MEEVTDLPFPRLCRRPAADHGQRQPAGVTLAVLLAQREAVDDVAQECLRVLTATVAAAVGPGRPLRTLTRPRARAA